jgi:hypothetical protein
MATKKNGRPRALVAAEHHEPPVKLTAAQRTLLNEALRRGEDVREQVEAAITSYGRWLLGNVFADDAAAAVDDRFTNPVWRELVRRAGGPTLKISRRMLYVSVQLAARDKRITDQNWQGLDAGRKELLLPLATDARLRAGAQHVAKFNLTHASTRQYVSEMLKANGKERVVRLTAPLLAQRVSKLRSSLGTAAVLAKVAELHKAAKPEERAMAVDEIEKLRDVLRDISKTLRKGA